MLHTLVALMDDEPGVLNRIASLFRRRAFNIHSLTVGPTGTPGISRMTVVVETDLIGARHVQAHLEKLVNVLQVDNLTDKPSVIRDLALIRVAANPDTRLQIFQLVQTFRASVLDVSEDSLAVEVTGNPAKLDAFVDVLRPFGILELGRTGVVAMARGIAVDNAALTALSA